MHKKKRRSRGQRLLAVEIELPRFRVLITISLLDSSLGEDQFARSTVRVELVRPTASAEPRRSRSQRRRRLQRVLGCSIVVLDRSIQVLLVVHPVITVCVPVGSVTTIRFGCRRVNLSMFPST